MNKLISVIIPVYNVQEYLERCLDSVIKNTYKKLEIICINDGSTDNSLNILRKYVKEDGRFIIIDQKNAGVSAARNAGLEIASGDYIAFVDSDDWVHPQYFETLMQMQEVYESDVAVCRYCRTETQIASFERIDFSLEQGKVLNLREALDDTGIKSSVWSRIYSARILKNLRFQNCDMAEDVLFNVNALCQDLDIRISLIDYKLYFYFIRENSIVHTNHASKGALIGEWYLDHYTDFHDSCIRSIMLEEGIKCALNYRYLTMFLNNDEVKKKRKQFIIRALKSTKKCELSKQIMYRIFIAIPIFYRLFRVVSDKTMLNWEKQQKRLRYITQNDDLRKR